MKQIISKDRRVLCKTSVLYLPAVVKEMKRAGYKVVEIKDETGEQM